jgi:hypothetical protein
MTNLPASVEKVLHDYVSQLNSVYPNGVVGIYVTGSVALGDYYSNKSDIDFITVLKQAPATELLKRIKHVHQRIEQTHNSPKLNGYYVTINGLNNKQASFPSFFKNRMYFERPFELDKVSLYEWRNYSYHVYGIPVAELQIEVELKDVITQLHQNINSYWTSWIRKHSALGYGHILLTLFPRLTEWGVLGVARQLYTMETGKITSKLNAGTYYLEAIPANLRDIMSVAIETRRINKTQVKPSFKRAKETLNCMQFILSEFNRMYNENPFKTDKL